MPTQSSSSVSWGVPHGRRSGKRSEGICGAQIGLLLQTMWAVMVNSHGLTYSTAWAQPRSQSSILVSEEPSPYYNYNLLVVFTWAGKPAMKSSVESCYWHLQPGAPNDPIHDGLGAWASVGFLLWLPGRDQVSSDAVVMWQLEILSKKYMKISCLDSFRGKQSDWGQKGDLEAERRWFLL